MANPTTIIITYLVYSGASPAVITTTTVTITIVSAGGSQADYSLMVSNIVRSGGFWFTDASGVLTFIPIEQIVKITAQ